jgi:hypothetical protein
MFKYDISMNALCESISRIPTNENDKIKVNVCIKTGEFTPFIRFGTDVEDTFGWVINKQYTTNKYTIPQGILGDEPIPMSTKAFVDSYLCPHKYRLDVRRPYYRGEKYDTLMCLELEKSAVQEIAVHGCDGTVYAHGFHSNCNTIFFDAMAPHISYIDQIKLVNAVLVSHEKNMSS